METNLHSEATLAPWTMALSHGTLEVRDIDKSRRFYSEFLGLETVKRGTLALWVRCGGGWMVACICMGERAKALPISSRWCLDMKTEEDVDAAYEAAQELKDEYGIKEIMPIARTSANSNFCLQDTDGNWWEITYRSERLYDRSFEVGQRSELRG